MSVTEEIWKDIEGFPGYQASSLGRIRSFWDFHGNITNKIRVLKPRINKDGYYELSLYTRERKRVTKRVHRLVAITFLGLHQGLVVNHINGDKLDNRIENLEWVTAAENSTLAAEARLYKTQPVRVVETGEVFNSVRECGEKIGIHKTDISHYMSGRYENIKGLHFEYISKDEYEECKKKPIKQPFLYPHQRQAIDKLFTGAILNGGVGSGKSRTGIYYYFHKYGGSIDDNHNYTPMKGKPPDLYIVTTAKKRNDLEFEAELVPFLLSTDPKQNQFYGNKVVIDSWNNIKKYADVKDAFFIFDEDKITGKGAWAQAFLKIAKNNEWIVMSATSGDSWQDYETIFVANGFFKNRTEMRREHYIYSQYIKNFPKVEGYRNEERLIRLRDRLLVDMDFQRHTIPHHEAVWVDYDIPKYKDAMRNRWDPFKNEPIEQAAGLCYVLRRIVNEHESRQVALLELFEKHPRMIVFYNFDYERDIILNLYYGEDVTVAEYSGHAHNAIPDTEKWIYAVQYTAGCEGFNCIKTDTIVFYSQNYSYKVMQQASGRIDRLNTPYTDLYYYHFKSRSGIDLAISKALRNKKKFNERKWVKWD